MATPVKLEAAFEADRSADPLSWTWTDLTDLTAQNATQITRGRSSSRSTVADPASATFPLINGDGSSVSIGSLTPRKGTGDWYPGVRKGLPLRYSVNAGQSWLALTGESGSRASTPDAASLDITSDIAIAVQFRAPIRPGPLGSAYDIMGKWGAAGQRSWRCLSGTAGTFNFQWSADGTATTGEAVTSLAVPSPDAGPLTVAVEFDVNNGDGGNTGTFYLVRGTLDSLLADPDAFLFADPDIASGTTSIFSSTANLELGDIANSGFGGYPGGIDRVYIRAGTLSSGTVVADADFTAETAGTTSFADDAATPKTWTINSPAEITDRKIRLLGEYGSNKGTYPGAGVSGTAQRAIAVAGPLRRMRQGAKPLRSALYRRATAPNTGTNVHAYFPLEDGRDATDVFSPVGGLPGGTMAMSLASDDTLPASQALPNVSGGQPYGWNLRFNPDAPATGWEATWFINLALQPTGSEIVDQRIDIKGGTTSQWVFRMDSLGYILFAKDLDGNNDLSDATGDADQFYGRWNIVTLTVAQDGSDIDWQVLLTPVDRSGTAIGSSGTLSSHTLGPPVGFRTLSASAPGDGFSVGHFMITSGATAAGLGWLAPADIAYAGEPDTCRVHRLCREHGIPVTVDGPFLGGNTTTAWAASIAAGAQPMGPQRPLPLLDLLEECADVGRGYLGETRELLGLAYRSGATLLEQSARLTLTTEVTEDGFESADDDQHYVNRAEVSRPDGSAATYTASGSDDPDNDLVGLYEQARTVNVERDADLLPHAAWWVHEATWPEERHDTVPIELAGDEDLIDTWHGFCVGDVISATSLPSAAERASISQLVDGWTETVSPLSWELRPNTRPAGAWDVGFTDDDPSTPDTDAARIDSSGTTLTGSLTSSATGATSVTVAGTLWTTAAGYFPMNVQIDEEVITLSGITGASSPQTFTISARGVADTDAAAHDAGAEIHPARPLRVAPSKRFP